MSAVVRVSSIAVAAMATSAIPVSSSYARTPLLEPAVVRRDVAVQLVVVGHELLEVVAGAEVGVEVVLGHEVLPVGRLVRALEQVDPELDLGGAQPGRTHHRAHDVVIGDVQTLLLAGDEILE